LAKANVPMLVTNHVYDVVGAYVPTKEISGGSGLKYAASSICMLTKKKDKDGTDIVGNLIKVRMHKSRFTKENKDVFVKLSYDSGLDRYYGLLDLAEKYDIIKKVSTRYELPDGRKVFGKAINENPEQYFTDDIMAQLEVAASKEFMYGQVGVDEEEMVEDASEVSTD
jgi:RecA/RadA recombinase